MIKRLTQLIYVFMFFISCSKQQEQLNAPDPFDQWLMKNAEYTVAEPTTGAIIFDISELKLNGKIVPQRGIYYYNPVPVNQNTFPTIKEESSSGYVRDIQLGSSISDCPNYKVSTSVATLKVVSGDKVYMQNNYPIALLQQETLPIINWTVNTPTVIEIVFKPTVAK